MNFRPLFRAYPALVKAPFVVVFFRPKIITSRLEARGEKLALAWLGVLFLVVLSGGIVNAQTANSGPSPPDYSALRFYENWEGNGDVAQCNGRSHGEIVTAYGAWSGPIRIDTDHRPGGCMLQIAVIDPSNVLRNWRVEMAFSTNGDGAQCINQGVYNIPIVEKISDARFSPKIIIDTDNRPGGCLLSFAVDGVGPHLSVYFDADGGDPAQCGNAGEFELSAGRKTELLIDADDRPGGCILQFQMSGPNDPPRPRH